MAKDIIKLGTLEEVDIRDIWAHEQYDFSNWLAEPKNIELLNRIIGLTLVDIQTEVEIGSYRCDIVAKDETSDTTVIIENQLEPTNHDHLGKIITYASGLGAKVVVWVVAQARDEHRSAIEWLNNNMSDKVGFFLLEIHAYKIGDSAVAPKLEVIEAPNDFIASGASASQVNNELKGAHLQCYQFWSSMNEKLISMSKPFNVRKATGDHWYDIAIGSSDAHAELTLVNKDGYVGLGLLIPKNKSLYQKLLTNKDEIENQIGETMTWESLEDNLRSKIFLRIKGLNFDDHSNYDQLISDCINKAIKMRDVFKQQVKKFF